MNVFPSASRRRTRGFSLVESITTLAVLMILGGLLLPALARQLRRAATTVCLANQRQFALVLELSTVCMNRIGVSGCSGAMAALGGHFRASETPGFSDGSRPERIAW